MALTIQLQCPNRDTRIRPLLVLRLSQRVHELFCHVHGHIEFSPWCLCALSVPIRLNKPGHSYFVGQYPQARTRFIDSNPITLGLDGGRLIRRGRSQNQAEKHRHILSK